MQFTISGIFQKYEDPFGSLSREIPQSFQRKLYAVTRSPLTFVILVWAMMFLFASLYFVYAQELHRNNPQSAPQKTHTADKSKTVSKKHFIPVRKIEIVEVLSVGPETLSTEFSRQAIAGAAKPDQ